MSYPKSNSDKIEPVKDNFISESEPEATIIPLDSKKEGHRRQTLSMTISPLNLELTLDESLCAPPSFAESQFETIVRRQKRAHDTLKISNVPTRYPNLPRDFEFAG
jgi:hypothetical protein